MSVPIYLFILEKDKNMKNLIYILFILVITGCSIAVDGTMRDNEGNIMRSSEAEIREAQSLLLSEDVVDKLAEKDEGAVLFDGKVVSVNINPSGLYVTLFDVDKLLFGDLKGEETVLIYSPSPGNTGIDFKQGEKYRVFCVDYGTQYRTWDWMGTVKLGDKGDGTL